MARSRDTWKHHPENPGYFVTEDGLKEMRMTFTDSFVICETACTKERPPKILRGPARDPVKLGIPKELAEEGERKPVELAVEQLRAGKSVTIDISSLAATARC